MAVSSKSVLLCCNGKNPKIKPTRAAFSADKKSAEYPQVSLHANGHLNLSFCLPVLFGLFLGKHCQEVFKVITALYQIYI